MFLHKLQTFWKIYRGVHGHLVSPDNLVIFPTNKCILNCVMCWRHGQPSEKTDAELTRDVLLGLVENSNVKTIQFTGGGEPLVYPFIKDAMALVKEKGIYGSLTTNGVFLDRFLDFLEEIRWDEVNVSLDGDFIIHDEIRGNGVFSKATKNLQEVGGNIKKGISVTIQKQNCQILSKMIKVAADVDAKNVRFQPQYPFQTETLLSELDETIAREQLILANHLATALHITTNASLYVVEPLEWYKCEPTFCCHPFISSVIDAEGNVRVCCIKENPMGNINQQSFQKIWTGKKYEEIRKLSTKGEMFRFCKHCNAQTMKTNNKVWRLLRMLP